MRILIIEDDKLIAQNIKEFLQQNTFSVDISNDWEDGFKLAKSSNPYDLIVLDINLPNKNWIDICNELRSIWDKTPIIMLTAKDSIESKIEWLDSWADDYLIKPFSLRELLSRINALLRRKYDNLDSWTEIILWDLILNTKTKKVVRSWKEIILTKKLFQILELLMRNKWKVLSKSEIEEHLWDMNAELWSDVVRSHIQLLRAKVDKGFPKKLIKTVHSMWYTINDDDE